MSKPSSNPGSNSLQMEYVLNTETDNENGKNLCYVLTISAYMTTSDVPLFRDLSRKIRMVINCVACVKL